ncbi:hypothetical protein D9611_008195 [Ephemerocybe angulata]|uniref:Protein kinase domain-containing protein n=1 Tax=Ephemerocybe angulata TaxID=980116 RepID=A0A8H5FCU3_9AGAR|nr:hypothetical protein D9611_008195 [Tulosesus angulatus]
MEALHMRFDLSYNGKVNPVSWQVADYAAWVATGISSSLDATGLTVTDLGGSVHKYPIQVAGYNFENSDEQESDHPAAMKLSWSEKSRPREKASERLDIGLRQNAIPQDCKADRVDPLLAARDPVFVLLSMFKPIATVTSLLEMELLNAFLALIYGHAILWSIGVEHGDISEENLMFDDVNKKPKLCDFDLSHLRGDRRPAGYSNTGTWAFMAMELLTEKAMNGQVARLYRHDFESFIAVLVWVVFRYRGGEPVPDPALEEWVQNQFEMCAAKRKHTFDQIAKGSFAGPVWLSQGMWTLFKNSVKVLRGLISRTQALANDIELANDCGAKRSNTVLVWAGGWPGRLKPVGL